ADPSPRCGEGKEKRINRCLAKRWQDGRCPIRPTRVREELPIAYSVRRARPVCDRVP
ncbi:hypothetical protein Pmar_PMAR004182, partial [Perkinsus marinus ATCC 50983]